MLFRSQRLLATLRNAGNVIAVAVIPYITQAMDLFAAAWPAVMNLANALGTALVSAAGGVYQAMTELVTPFEGLATAVTDTFGAIFAALTANDIGAAADVFWASLNVAWTTGIAAITDQWYAWKNGFLDVFDEATGAVAVKWFEFKNTIVNIFVSAITSIKNAWTDFQSWLSSWVVLDMQILGIINNADEVQKTLQETTKSATDKATAQADAALAASDVATAEQIAEVRAATQREQQRRADEYARQLDKAQADLDSAKMAWSASLRARSVAPWIARSSCWGRKVIWRRDRDAASPVRTSWRPSRPAATCSRPTAVTRWRWASLWPSPTCRPSPQQKDGAGCPRRHHNRC